jgi:type VII secretion-associated serine protease mycosin
VNGRTVATALLLAVGFASAHIQIGAAHADTTREDQWHLKALGVPQANRISRGESIVVAVVDTGVDLHPDLRTNLLQGGSVLPSRLDNGQGDPNGHGTLMASLIAASGGSNNSGVVGIAPAAKILPVRDSDAEGRGNSVRAAEAIEWAISRKANIINFSRAVAPSIALKNAVERAAASDVLIVAASGNKGQDVVAAYPAAMESVLAVGASDRSNKPADFTKPSKQVQICAPGVDIVGAKPDGRYFKGQGTSQATAIVSGAAALVMARFPDLSAPEVIHRLTATADDIGEPGRDDECGFGVLNIVKALTADVPPLAGSTDSPSLSGAASAPRDDGDEAGPGGEPAGNSIPLIATGIGAVLVLVGALIAFLLVRRRKAS